MMGWKKTQICVMLLFIVCTNSSVFAQSDLFLKRVVPFTGHTELFYNADCTTLGVRRDITKKLDAADFRIYENGEEITDFTVTCIGNGTPVSVVVVLDGNGSSDGLPRIYMHRAAHDFTDKLVEGVDEVALRLSGNGTGGGKTFCHLTTDLDSMHRAIDRSFDFCCGGGASPMLAIENAILELRNSSNPVKVVLIFHLDMFATTQTNIFPSIIEAAQREHVRVIFVFEGTTKMKHLDSVAVRTGGRSYFDSPNPGQYIDDFIYYWDYQEVFMNAADYIHAGFEECMISYPTSCPDGSERKVEVELLYDCSTTPPPGSETEPEKRSDLPAPFRPPAASRSQNGEE